ncbi:MAG: hypothetical protein FD130_2559 [Halothiobacillaceae bacterium]|nr:MAG: hypothetical protein FD130_2559 [Halothiobacillaceae bacterium]
MSEQTVSPATPLAAATEVVEAVLPGENGSSIPDATAVQRLMEQINVAESSTILYFGNQAQQQLTEIADSMLEGGGWAKVNPP